MRPSATSAIPKLRLYGDRQIEVLEATSGNYAPAIVLAGEDSSVNRLQVTATATGNDVLLESVGDDADVSINIVPKGTGVVDVASILGVSGEIELLGANKWIAAEAPGGDTFPVANFTAVDNSVNNLAFTSSATGNFPGIAANGTDDNINLHLSSKGTGNIQATGFLQLDMDSLKGSLGDLVLEFVPQSSAVNFVQIQNNTTGNPAVIAAAGTDSDIGITLTPKGIGGVTANSELFVASNLVFQTADSEIWVESPSTGGKAAVKLSAEDNAVNNVQLTGTATGNNPTIAAAGTDSDISLNLTSKGTGTVQVNGTALVGADYAGMSVDDNATETTFQLTQVLTKISVFDTNGPNSGSTPDQTRSEITIGATGDYEITFTGSGSSSGTNKTYEIFAYQLEATTAITGITAANPGVVTAAGHGLSNGDMVAIKDIVGMVELNDQMFEVAGVSGDTFTLKDDGGTDINTSGYTAYSSAGSVQKALETTCHAHRKFAVTGDVGNLGSSTIANLTSGNFLQLYVSNVTDTTALTMESANLCLKRLG